MKEHQEHQVIFSSRYKRELWKWLNRNYRSKLTRILREPRAVESFAGAEQLQALIRKKLAKDGIKDAEDLYQLLIGTNAEEYWCEVLNSLSHVKK